MKIMKNNICTKEEYIRFKIFNLLIFESYELAILTIIFGIINSITGYRSVSLIKIILCLIPICFGFASISFKFFTILSSVLHTIFALFFIVYAIIEGGVFMSILYISSLLPTFIPLEIIFLLIVFRGLDYLVNLKKYENQEKNELTIKFINIRNIILMILILLWNIIGTYMFSYRWR